MEELNNQNFNILEKKKKSKLTLITIVVILIVVISAVAYGVWWYYFSKSGQTAMSESTKTQLQELNALREKYGQKSYTKEETATQLQELEAMRKAAMDQAGTTTKSVKTGSVSATSSLITNQTETARQLEELNKLKNQ